MTFTREIFQNEHAITSWLPRSFQNLATYLRFAACIAFKRSLIQSRVVETLYRQAFEDRGGMMFSNNLEESPTKVAVTTYDADSSLCSIITTYNRPIEDESKPFHWLQEDESNLQIAVWEA
jgi:hypothetical protein